VTQIDIKPIGPKAAKALAQIHAQSFDKGWSEQDFKTHIAQDLTLGVWQAEQLAGFIILRCVADQAEIITIAISPSCRGQGLGAHLLEAAEAAVKLRGVEIVFLEVAEDNPFAIRLYRGAAYNPIGRRPAYYRRAEGRVAALNFSKNLMAG